MTDKTYLPESIAQNPLPVAGEVGTPAGSATVKAFADTQYTPSSFNQSSLPSNRVAGAVISESINTQQRRILGNYTFGTLGAIKISSKTTSAYVKISPDGILGVNSAGTTTFTIDSTTGNATFRGTIYALAGEIGGFTIASSYLYAGSGANTAGISPADYPFWAGATYANRATAPFRVTPAGALVASNATITGDITATSGTIGGWTIAATTLTGGDTILNNNGTITVSNGNDKVEMTTASSVGYLDFYASGALKARIRGTTSRSGGALLTQGDLVIANNYAFLATGTSASDFARFGVTSSNQTWLVTSSDDVLYIMDHDEHQLLAISDGNVNFGGNDHQLKIQLHEMGEPSNPSSDTCVLFCKDNGAGKTQLFVRFQSGASQSLALEP